MPLLDAMMAPDVLERRKSGAALPTILLIEDEADDVYLLRRATADSKLRCEIRSVDNVPAAMDYLERGRVLPHLIITDLGFCGYCGLDFLTWLRFQPQLRRIPVVCLTGSCDPEKLRQVKNLGARCVPKSAGFEEVITAIRDLVPL